MYETIDLLQQTTDYYYIDYIPYNTDDPNFLELEEYFEKHYLSSFSEKIIKQVILTDFSSLQILFSTPKFLISICGDFSVTIYGIKGNNEAINLLQQLTTQEGLFLTQNNPS